MATTTKTARLGTVWAATARIQIINETTMKWDTLGSCVDTPAGTRAEVARIRRDAGPTGRALSLWILHEWGREYVGQSVR